MNRLTTLISCALGLALLSTATSASARGFVDPMFRKPKPKRFVSPGKSFVVNILNSWAEVPRPGDPNLFEFQPRSAKFRVFISVRRVRVPRGASSVQIALNVKEQRLAKLPLWKEMGTTQTL